MNREDKRGLAGSLPRWARSRYALTIPLLLCLVPVVVSLLRASHFDVALEVFPRMPPGNAGVSSEAGRALGGVVANPGFELSAWGWAGGRLSAPARSTAEAHSGTASLATADDPQTPADGRLASTGVVLPAAGSYRVQAWVRLPGGYRGGPPRVELAGLAGSSRAAARAGDLRVRGRWQLISSDHVVSAEDLRGVIVLRAGPSRARRAQVLYWDDVQVLSHDAGIPAPPRMNLVFNPGFEYDRTGWGDPPAFVVARSHKLAHNGSGSLRSASNSRAPLDTNAGYTHIVFPRAGTYRARAWVHLPRRGRPARPAVFLEGFSASTRLVQRFARPGRRGTWQQVSADYSISSQDLEGSLVLRDFPSGAAPRRGRRDAGARTVLHWDDVSVAAPRAEPPVDVRVPADAVRSAVAEPQLRFDVAQMTGGDRLYNPARTTVVRSRRKGTLSFIVRVATDVPSDARRLAAPLRAALVRVARRDALRRAGETWQQFISTIGTRLLPEQRARLQRRADVVQRMIGAQAPEAVATPVPAPKPTLLTRKQQRQAQRDRQKVISRLGSDLPSRQRALVAQRVDDLQRLIGAQTAEFLVLPSGRLPQPARRVDRVLDALPGPFPPRVGPVSAGASGLVCALLLLGMLAVMTAARRRSTAAGG